MTGEEFVRLCFEEKEAILREYCAPESETAVSEMVRKLVNSGAGRDALRKLLDLVMTESWYTMLLALDGDASLSGNQQTYRLYDEENHLLNECGELAAAAWDLFMEKND